MHLGLRRGREEDDTEVGKQGGMDYRRFCALLRVDTLISKVWSPRCTETWAGLPTAKMSLLLKKF